MQKTGSALPRRTVLRGAGAVIGLPFLEAMIPGGVAKGREARRPRLVAIEMVHGAAGSTDVGRSRNLWSPAASGSDFDLTPTLQSLAPFRDHLTIVSNTRLGGIEAHSTAEDGDGVDHARSSAGFLTGAHPIREASAMVSCGPSLDQLFARHVGSKTPIPSMELSIEELKEPPEPSWPAGYSPAYRHAISWRDARSPVLPEARMSLAFARLFGPASATDVASGSILDGIVTGAKRLQARLSVADRQLVDAHLTDVRDLEKRITRFEREQAGPEPAPASYIEQFRMMSDLVALAFAADLTRVFSLKLGLDRSQRVFAESGVTTPFHTASHHRYEPEKLEAFARINEFHVRQIAYLLDRLNGIHDDGETLLDRSLTLYGSPMGDSHVHGHANLPIFLAGRADGVLRGNQHVLCKPDEPMANLLLTVARRLGLSLDRLGESTGEIAI